MTHAQIVKSNGPAPRGTVAAVVLGGSAMVFAAASAWAIATGAETPHEIPATPASTAACAGAVLVLGLTAGGVVFWPRPRRGPRLPTAVAMMAFAWASLAPLVVPGAPAIVRFAAYALVAVLPAALLHVVGAISARPLPRSMIPAAYGLLAALATLRSLFAQPYLDPDCQIDCAATGVAPFTSPALLQAVGAALSFASAITAIAVAVVAIRGMVSPRRGPRSPRILLGIVVAIALVELATLTVPEARPVLGPPPPTGDSLLILQSAATIALCAGVLVRAARRARRTAALRRALDTAARAGESAGLEGVLSRALRDPQLRLDFWLPTLGRWADASGAAAAEDEVVEYGVIRISDRGAIIARVLPGRPDGDPADLLSVVGSAALLLIDTERLRVERLAQAGALRESLVRIVETSDAARRQLERELHDGAQQRLLAAILSYRLAADEAASADESTDAATDVDVMLGVLSSLREAAQGLYPPVLADAGLVAALESLARSARVRVSVASPSLPRLDSSIEYTLYLAAREAVTRAVDLPVDLTIRRESNRLALAISPSAGFRTERLADRVQALDGSIRTNGSSVILEVPCG